MYPGSLNDQLIEAVTYHNVAEVTRLLEAGADPNYETFTGMKESGRQHQPYTPLRLVMFCISDSLLEDADIAQHAEVAKLLLRYGADPEPAMALAEQRYGKYDPQRQSRLMPAWRVVAAAMK